VSRQLLGGSVGTRIAVDIGGTFVDAIEFDPMQGTTRLAKASTTPAAPATGVLDAVGILSERLDRLDTFTHGTTLGLNAILERRGALTGLITNAGFRDILEIGRSDVPFSHMYDFRYVRPRPLVPRRRTRGVAGRVDHRGRELQPLDEAAVEAAARSLVDEHGCEAIAICFLHSYANPDHERRAAQVVRRAFPSVTVSASVDVAPEYREYERTSTTVVDAYISPIFARYIDALGEALQTRGHGGRFLITRSAGGAMTADEARRAPILTVLSGPAGGIIGASAIARAAGLSDLITFDVGGTSVDACVVLDGRPTEVYEASLEHLPLLIPIYDIRTLGSGGGSIARVEDGLLLVGPQSAGAVPGPVAYGRGGTRPTVTDAALVLGYLDPEQFLGGAMRLDLTAARAAVEEQLARPLGRGQVEAAAAVFDVMMAQTTGAIREITVERGMDPRQFVLLAYGGAGPLVATSLAREMDLAEVVVPQMPAGFSAWGMLMADIEVDVARTVLARVAADLPGRLDAILEEVRPLVFDSLARQGIDARARSLVARLDVRYVGQEHVLEVPYEAGMDAAVIQSRFAELHEHRYGHRLESQAEVVTLRVRGLGQLPKPGLPSAPPPTPAQEGSREAFDLATRSMRSFRVIGRESMAPGGDWESGPALLVEPTAVTVVHGDQKFRLDELGLIRVRRG
jgi:N-methylhydantoinase A